MTCRFIHTRILSDQVADLIKSAGVDFAEVEDAASAILHFAADKSINGNNPLSHVFGLRTNVLSGRAFGVVPKSISKRGYYDLERDDWAPDDFIKNYQDEASTLISNVRRPDRSS